MDLQRLEAVIKDVEEYSPKDDRGNFAGRIENDDDVRAKLEELGVEVRSTNEAITGALEYLNEQTL